jgi:outer membrane biosynthesis protein TonB
VNPDAAKEIKNQNSRIKNRVSEVTDVIVARSRPSERLKAMTIWSVAAHVTLIATILLMPTRAAQEAPRTVMTISLGGAPGPRAGGMTQAGGRAVQTPPPPEPVRRADSGAAPTRPAMTLPDPRARTRPQPKPEQAPKEATSRTLATGEQPREGSTRVETGARGQGFGLSTGGGGGTGVQLDVANFCCPEYLEQMVSLIQRNWDQNQGVVGTTTMKFTIERDGMIVMPLLERSSGFFALDNAAQRALLLTKLTPLPAAFPNPSLTVHIQFKYSR